MKLGFFIPCYIDALMPSAAMSAYNLLKRFGDSVEVIEKASCCALPFTDMGYHKKSCSIENNSIKFMMGYDAVVVPSGICTDQLRNHFTAVEPTPEVAEVRSKCYEVVEFLHDVKQVDSLPWAYFPHRVALHNGCHALRYLHEASPTELVEPQFSKPEALLSLVDGLEVGYPTRRDECCGFGGIFTIWDKMVSGQMGQDKVNDYETNGFEYVTSPDCSCLLHQSMVAKKLGLPIKFHYIAEILNGDVH